MPTVILSQRFLDVYLHCKI